MIRYRILPEQKLIVVCTSETTSAQEIMGLSEGLRSDPDFSADFDALVDNTLLEHPATSGELRELAEPRLSIVRTDAKLAVIAPTDVAYGTSRMHQALAEFRSPLHIEIFRDRDAALKWLGKEGVGVEDVLEEMRRSE